ncbi:molybdopterin-dependent oxidoreductase [Pseudohaliea sp.]|uniref:molybdopterin-containing oxidoreductase family protein n=1 Tax=Pseudohaliea sp. TaxID=2740289 RepID=UPI0032EB32BB
MNKTVKTFCRLCEPLCGLEAQLSDTDDNVIVKLAPDRSHPVHKGFACHKGLKFLDVHNDPDRLNFPLRRREATGAGAGFEPVAWDQAIDDIAGRIRRIQEEHGPESVAMFIGNPSAFNSTARYGTRKFAYSIGARDLFGSTTQDTTNKFAAAEAVYGSISVHPLPDLDNTDFLLSIGSNPRISHMTFVNVSDPMGKIRDIVRRGGRVVHVNPRKIESAGPNTGEVLQVKPDTDFFLLAAILNTIFEEGWCDEAALSTISRGLDELRNLVREYKAAKVTNVVGVTAGAIEDLARDFAQSDSAAAYMATGANMGRLGTLTYWLLQMLSLVTGNLGRCGGNVYSPGYPASAAAGKVSRDVDPYFESDFGRLRRVIGLLPGNLLADHIASGRTRALICLAGNPLLSMGGEVRLRKALGELDLLVTIDIYPNATSRFAHYQLPATDWLEREDINFVSQGNQLQPYLQYTDAVVEPAHERKPEWWIFQQLLQAWNEPGAEDTPPANHLERIARDLRRAGIELDSIKDASPQVMVLPKPAPDEVFRSGIQHDDGLIDCFPAAFSEALLKAREIYRELSAEPADQIKLITLRTNYMMNSWLNNLEALKRRNARDNPIFLNPDDADSLGLGEDDTVVVSSEFGAVECPLQIDRDLRRGVAAMTHGWGHRDNESLSVASRYPGTNVNELLPTGPGSYESLSNQAHMTGIPVRIKKAR